MDASHASGLLARLDGPGDVLPPFGSSTTAEARFLAEHTEYDKWDPRLDYVELLRAKRLWDAEEIMDESAGCGCGDGDYCGRGE